MNKMEEKKQREGRGEPLGWLNQWKEMTLASPTGTSADRPPPRPTCTYYRYHSSQNIPDVGGRASTMLPGKVHRIGSTRYTVKLYVPGMHEPKAGTNTHAKTTMRSCCTCGSYLLERDYSKQNQSSSVAEDNRQDRQMIESVMMMMMAMTPKLAAVVQWYSSVTCTRVLVQPRWKS